MRNPAFVWILAAIMLLLDWYVFQAIKTVTSNSAYKVQLTVKCIFITISALTILSILLFPYLQILQTNKFFRNYIFAILVGLFFAKIVAVIFFLVDDVRRGAIWLMSKIFPETGAQYMSDDQTIHRSTFLSWMGLGAGSLLYGSLLYGFSNKYNYQLTKINLTFNNLPSAFKGLKMIHISDIHCGSFNNKEAVQKGIDLINAQKPDIILFTGDLVNDRQIELGEYQNMFAQLKAPMGVYSTLGNHDYGDYVQWETREDKLANLQALKDSHAAMGWQLMMNTNKIFTKDNQSIALLGIENWGAKGRFPKYGKMNEAYKGVEDISFKILLSHDPSHWDAQIKTEYKDIDLMLSGHTHGMQFGFETPFVKWSPVQWVYKQWAGLYEEGNQKLYVNRGFGFIGYPGRVGILPEITVINLI